MPLSVDAYAAYRLDDTAELAALDAFNLVMIEQPLAGDDLVRHARLQARLATPICLDESIPHAGACRDALELAACRIVNIKPGRVGGHAEAIRIHDLCRDQHVPVWCGGMLETGIGRAHNVALASLPNFRLPNDLSPSARYWTEDIVSPEWTMHHGLVTVPRTQPGLGVTVRSDMIDHRTTWMDAWQA
jgi:O-succinylbenzoate synthase